MTYFNNFPIVYYKFGNEEEFNLFQNVSAYVDIVDRLKENSAFYTLYTIQDGERADQLSQTLYGTTDYYWTFYALNENLKQFGWPIQIEKVTDFVKGKYPNVTLVTRDYFYDKFVIGERVQGTNSGAIGVVLNKISDFGHIVVKTDDEFEDGEEISTIDRDSDDIRSIILLNSMPEYQSPHHFESKGKWVDIDPTIPLGSEIVPITKTEYYLNLNEERKVIRVFRDNAIRNIVSTFNKVLRETLV